ncbi:MAG: prepilin-type N-terminal cleavage/methylation domain-containing protein [Verrucomicrobiae bacterium]|nr:prepilin-type N-terminal cleavage/methylation domain-containing protein [Verrucomicrobiae bacterium]
MNPKRLCRLEAGDWRKKKSTGFSLFELLISLALLTLMLTLLITTGTQTAKMWSESEEQTETLNEAGALLQMIYRDLRSASLCSEKLTIDIPLASRQKNIFFLTRTPADDLVTVGYLFDPKQQGYCYRFFANAQETLTARKKGTLIELESRAAPGEAHCEVVATHLLSWEMTPVWKNEKQLTLFEINLAFGKTTPRYFLSTVISLPPS